MKTNIFYSVIAAMMCFCGNIFAQEVGDYGFETGSSVNYNTVAAWKICKTAGTWTDAEPATAFPNSNTINVWILSGTAANATGNCKTLNILPGATMQTSGDFFCHADAIISGTLRIDGLFTQRGSNLTVNEGGILTTNTVARQLRFGTSLTADNTNPQAHVLTNNGTISGDNLELYLYQSSNLFTITGEGSATLKVLGPMGSGKAVQSQSFVIDADVTIKSSIQVTQTWGDESVRTRTLTINSGKTVTLAPNAYFHYAKDRSSVHSGGSGTTDNCVYIINGTLDVSDGIFNLCTAQTGTWNAGNRNQYVRMEIGPEGLVKCGA
jgi:hypothetical protein